MGSEAPPFNGFRTPRITLVKGSELPGTGRRDANRVGLLLSDPWPLLCRERLPKAPPVPRLGIGSLAQRAWLERTPARPCWGPLNERFETERLSFAARAFRASGAPRPPEGRAAEAAAVARQRGVGGPRGRGGLLHPFLPQNAATVPPESVTACPPEAQRDYRLLAVSPAPRWLGLAGFILLKG